MANTFKFGNGNWATKEDSVLAYNDENNNFKPLPFDFTRASTATYVDSDGLIKTARNGEARIDYTDSTDGALLLEPSRSNLITYSEELTQWIDTGTTTVLSNITSPSGSLQSYLLSAASSSTNALRYNLSFSASTNYSYSLFFKAGTSQEVRVQIYDGSSFFRLAVNPLNNFEIVDQSGVNSYLIEDFTNGWKKVSINITTSASASSGYLQIYPDRTGNLNNVYLWGAQLEAGSYATSYIPTNGSSVTRAGDSCSGAGNSEVFNDSEGVLFIETAALFDDTTNRYIGLNDGTTSNRILIGYSTQTNRIRVLLSDGGVQKAIISYDVTDRTNFSKMAVKYKENDVALWVDGVERGTDTTATMPSGLDELDCNSGAGLSPFLGKIKQIKVYNTALTDAELATLTQV